MDQVLGVVGLFAICDELGKCLSCTSACWVAERFDQVRAPEREEVVMKVR